MSNVLIVYSVSALIFLIGWLSLKRKSNALNSAKKELDLAIDNLNQDRADIQRDIDEAKEKTQKMKNALLCINSQYENMVKRYMTSRISLLSMTNPDFSGSAELLYKMDDLRVKKETGEINSVEYMMEVDKIFFELESNNVTRAS